jgi:hypothetical protein
LTIAIVLIVASALVGIATGYFFRIWALVVIAPIIAILSAVVLRSYEFGMLAGVSVIAACLAICQLAYLAATFLLDARHISIHDEINGQPGEQGERKIGRQHE